MAKQGHFDTQSSKRIAGSVHKSELMTEVPFYRRNSTISGLDDVARMFDVLSDPQTGADDKLKIRPGLWMQNGGVAWTHVDSISTLPFTDSVVIPIFENGFFYVYAVLIDSFETGSTLTNLDFRYDEGASWITTSSTNEVIIVFRDKTIERAEVDPFGQWKLIAVVSAEKDAQFFFKITRIDQYHRGIIEPPYPVGTQGGAQISATDHDPIHQVKFHFNRNPDCFSTGQTSPFVTVKFNAKAPEIGRNSKWTNSIAETKTYVDLTSGSNYAYLALIDPSVSSWSTDPNVDPSTSFGWQFFLVTSAALVHQGFSNWFRIVYFANKLASDNDDFTPMNWIGLFFFPNNARPHDLWIRPDSQRINDSTRSSTVDSDLSPIRAFTVGFNDQTASKHKGELEWYQFMKRVGVDSDIGDKTNDAIFGAFKYKPLGDTKLDYYRIDGGFDGSSTASAWPTALSLHITTDHLQIFGFQTTLSSDAPSDMTPDPVADEIPTEWSAGTNDSIEKKVMLRLKASSAPTTPYVGYVDLSQLLTYPFDKKSLNTRNAASQNQLHNFATAVGLTTITDTDLLTYKDVSTGFLEYLEFGDLQNWDECSINAPTPTIAGQVFNFAGATSLGPLQTNDLVLYKDATTGCMNYVLPNDMKQTVAVAHHSLPPFVAGEFVGAQWSDFDDHGGSDRLTAPTADLYVLFLVGDPNILGKAAMYTRNQGPNFSGNDFFVEGTLFVDSIFEETNAIPEKRIEVFTMELFKGNTKIFTWDDDALGHCGTGDGSKMRCREATIATDADVFGDPSLSVEGGVFVADGFQMQDGDINIRTGVLKINGTQVVGPQGAFIADITVIGNATDGEVRTKLNDLMSELRTHGLIL